MTRTGPVRVAAVAAHFGRDIDRALSKVAGIVADARKARADLLVLPHATLGGYLEVFGHPHTSDLPPALAEDSAEIAEMVRLAGTAAGMVVCFGYTEATAGMTGVHHYNTALCIDGSGILGRHRKVHRPAGEADAYDAGDRLAAFDTPIGRMGMLIDYDKTFPEAARRLALDGAVLVACLSAWPASITDRTVRLTRDRQSRLFDLYDSARAAENQIVWASSNQTGVMGELRFLGQAKVVGPGGDVLDRTWAKGGMAVAEIDLEREVTRSRRVLHHLQERRPSLYTDPRTRTATTGEPPGA